VQSGQTRKVDSARSIQFREVLYRGDKFRLYGELREMSGAPRVVGGKRNKVFHFDKFLKFGRDKDSKTGRPRKFFRMVVFEVWQLRGGGFLTPGNHGN
jgi:hypothetical protein